MNLEDAPKVVKLNKTCRNVLLIIILLLLDHHGHHHHYHYFILIRYPTTTGTSVLGVKFDGGVLLAADTLG